MHLSSILPRARVLPAILITLALLAWTVQPAPVNAQVKTPPNTTAIWEGIAAAHSSGNLIAEHALAGSLPEADRRLYLEGQAAAQKDPGPSGGGPFIGINGAPCAYTFLNYYSAAVNGDTIYIAPDPPVGNFGGVNKNLTFTAATSNCTAQAAGPVVITGDLGNIGYGGIAEIGLNKTVTFRNLVIQNNGTANYGGILFQDAGSTVNLDNTDLYSGSARYRGGGVRMNANSTLNLTNGSQIYGNVATDTVSGAGGGVYAYKSTINLYDTSRIGNTAEQNYSPTDGGGVYLDNSILNMYGNSKIAGNEAAGDGGGVYAVNASRVNLHNSASIGYSPVRREGEITPQGATFDNLAFNGGGVFLSDPGTQLTMLDDSGIYNNSAGNAGGGIYAVASATVSIDSASINSNYAYDRGGGMIIFNNVNATITNGSWFSYNWSANVDGAIAIAADGSTLNITDSSLYWNSAPYYGGIRLLGFSTLNITESDIQHNSATTGSGGALALKYGTTTITGTTLQNNYAFYDGGAIYHDSGSLQLSDADIRYNTAEHNGGGIYNNDGNLTFWAVNQDSYLSNNTATNGGGVYAAGNDFLQFRSVDGRLLNISENQTQVGGSGGGIYSIGTTVVLVYGKVQFTGNVAHDSGGAIYQNGGSLTVDDLDRSNYPQLAANIAIHGDGGGIYATNVPSVLLYGIDLGNSSDGNSATDDMGGGVFLTNSTTAYLYNVIAQNNLAGRNGGALAVANGSIANIQSSFFPLAAKDGNQPQGGSSTSCDPYTLSANHYCSEFRGNSAGNGYTGYGGAIYVDGNSGAYINETNFYGNTASGGGAIEAYYGMVDVKNSLFSANDGTSLDSAVHVSYLNSTTKGTFNCELCTFVHNPSSPVYYNNLASGMVIKSIIWNNSLAMNQGSALFFCDDYDGGVLPGSMNISQDPRFVTTLRGQYRLGPDSPAIDACTTGSGPDLDGLPRPIGGVDKYDMGAFETPLSNFLPMILQ